MNDRAQDEEVIRQCLRAAAEGPFFDDWEFSTLFGFEREEIRRIAERWPEWDDEIRQADAVTSTLNNLLRYPRGRPDSWREYIAATPDEVARTEARWAGEDGSDDSGQGYFDRLR